MDWSRLQAAIIRAFWSFVFPMIGALVAWLQSGQNLESIGVTNVLLASVVSAILYGVKKAIWPDTTF